MTVKLTELSVPLLHPITYWRTAVIIAALGLTIAGVAAGSTPEALAGLEKINLYCGTWRADVQDFDTTYSKAGSSSKIIRNECWANGAFFAVSQIVNGESKALVVYTYDTKTDLYHTFAVLANDGKAGTLIIKGNVWTYPSDYVVKDKTIHLRIVNTFTSPTTIEFKREYSEDGVTWIAMSTGREVKG